MAATCWSCAHWSSHSRRPGARAHARRRAAAHGRAVPAAGSRAARSARPRRVAEAGSDHGRAADRRRRDGGRHRRRRRLVHDPAGAARGPERHVYAEDVQRQMLEAIRRRVQREGLQNVETRARRRAADPNLPAGALDAVLVVDVYPGGRRAGSRDVPAQSRRARSSPDGRIGIVNYKPGGGGPGPDASVRVTARVVEADARAAGLRSWPRATCRSSTCSSLGR